MIQMSLTAHAASGDFQRLMAKLNTAIRLHPSLRDLRLVLAGILLLETHERPPTMRMIEWIASGLLRRPNITRGPYQMRRAPWGFDRATQVAARKLTVEVKLPNPMGVEPIDVDAIARCWNGSCTPKGSVISYADALKIAVAVVTNLKA